MAMPTITLRPATTEELPALSELCLRSKAVWGYDQAFLDGCRDELTFSAEGVIGTTLVVAEIDGDVAGLYQLQVRGDDSELLKLYVDPKHLGHGLGRVLFEAAGDEARARGATRMIIESDPSAAPFYQRMGGTPAGSVPSGSIPGRRLPSFECRL